MNPFKSKTIEVLWTTNKNHMQPDSLDMVFIPPEPALANIVNVRNKTSDFLRCPAFLGFFKNTFLVRSALDMEFYATPEGHISTDKHEPWFINAFMSNEGCKESDVYKFLQLQTSYMFFYSRQSVEIQQLPAFMEHSECHSNIKVIPGEFNISKWIRGLVFAFEVTDVNKPVIIKRGDPLYYVKFITPNGEKVVLKQTDYLPDLADLASKCISLKKLMPMLSLKENYDMAGKAIANFWSKRK